jgi:dolichyl-phosphate beta-glucosyltransferase
LTDISEYLSGQSHVSEVIVVDDGSEDATAQLVSEFGASNPPVKLLQAPHRGKGHAVKLGMLAAKGELRFLCDADLSMPIEEVARFLPPELGGYDIALGSREVSGAKRFDEPTYRHVMGRAFNLIVQAIAVPGITDTQCGFKCFTAEAAQKLFALQKLDGFAFDVEILFLARKLGLRIVEVPINWFYQERSKVNPINDTLGMLAESLKVRWNFWRGRYNPT